MVDPFELLFQGLSNKALAERSPCRFGWPPLVTAPAHHPVALVESPQQRCYARFISRSLSGWPRGPCPTLTKNDLPPAVPKGGGVPKLIQGRQRLCPLEPDRCCLKVARLCQSSVSASWKIRDTD